MTTGDAQQAVNFGVAHGALAMTTPGDTSMASLKEVEKRDEGRGRACAEIIPCTHLKLNQRTD